ncbi:MAG: hypothetical protein ACRCUU_10740 [Plesiomonas sp.]
MKYTPPKAIISLDGEFLSLEADASILDTGIVFSVLNDDGVTYSVRRWYHHLDGINNRDQSRTASRRVRDWWLTDSRGSWHPDIHSVAYINMSTADLNTYVPYAIQLQSNHRMHLVRHAMFINQCMRDFNIGKLEFVVCAKGPDTDCTIYNNAFAMHGIDFNYRFARYSSIRDIERANAVFKATGIGMQCAERTTCSIPFAPKDYYSSGRFRQSDASQNAYHRMPPANTHVALYDAWLESMDAMEYYAALNMMHTGKVSVKQV